MAIYILSLEEMSTKYCAFTLVEMLVVMGIIIILITVGVVAGRFAIRRANDIVHMNAVDSLYEALQAYYVNNREFPFHRLDGCVAPMIFSGYALYEYIDGSIDFGDDATYFYYSSNDQQDILVCVSMWGFGDVGVESTDYVYCNGNGFGSYNLGAENITSNKIYFGSDGYHALIYEASGRTCNWYRGKWQY